MRVLRVTSLALLAALTIALSTDVPTTSAHHQVMRVNLEEMTVTADRIFIGRCVRVEPTEEMISGGLMPVTHYTFEVERPIKGAFGRQVTIRQLGHPMRRATGKGRQIVSGGRVVTPSTFIHGMSEYQEGERLALFLIPEYTNGKVTYPVGLYQGAFQIVELPSGKQVVRNSINNMGLFTAPYNDVAMKESAARLVFPDHDMPATGGQPGAVQIQSLSRKRGALPLDDFVAVIENIRDVHGQERGRMDGLQKGVMR